MPDLIELLCRPHYSLDTIIFYHTPAYKDKIVLHQKYIVEGLSIRQIALQFLSSKEAIRMALHEHGIPLRKQSLPHGKPSQIKYGKKIIKGKLQDSISEQRIIKTIKEMKSQGLSLRQIAKNLSTMKIPTKENGKKWHPEMIRRILGRL